MTTATKIVRPRIARATNDAPLTLDQIRHVAPAVFQTQAHSRMSDSYAYIPTITILEALMSEGFTVQEVCQARPYAYDRDPFAKHMLRLRTPGAVAKAVGDVVPEIVLINAHDGTARYYLYGGLYRMVCANGMMMGKTIASMTVAHRGGELTRNKVIEGSYTIVKDEFPRMLEQRQAMLDREVSRDEEVLFAHRALALRYADGLPPFGASLLLNVRRSEDDHPTLWHLLNKVQENVIDAGFASRSVLFNRLTHIRPVEQVNQRVKINRGIWDIATEMLQAA